ncbi:hypothetical protein C8J38_107158 [Rhizobium sp. PP-WC-2G-219]|nr:hypothetical protein C8J38_107158 [Rhizobium sp. PP-WC-2G-219]
MEEIFSPKFAKDHPEYVLECEEAMDLPIQELIEEAVQAGRDNKTILRCWPSSQEQRRSHTKKIPTHRTIQHSPTAARRSSALSRSSNHRTARTGWIRSRRAGHMSSR